MELSFDKFLYTDEPFAKALRSLETCVLVNNNLCEKLVLSQEFEESFKVTSIPFFFPDFDLLSCQLDNVTFKVLY